MSPPPHLFSQFPIVFHGLKNYVVIEWAERVCLDSGLWEGPSADASEAAAAAMLDAPPQSQGWTNYTQCFLPEIRDLMKKLDSGSRQEAEVGVIFRDLFCR